MILIDSSVWIDHFRSPDAQLSAIIRSKDAALHPYVLAELALGYLPDAWALPALRAMPSTSPAHLEDMLDFIATRQLQRTGIGFVDAHLLVAASQQALSVWTRDRRLQLQAERLGLAYEPQ